MNKDAILSILRKNIILIIAFVAVIGAAIFFVGFSQSPKAPVLALINNIEEEKKLDEEISSLEMERDRIKEELQRKNDEAKEKMVKDFYPSTDSGDLMSEFSPMFDNIIAMIKQNGLRMKSIEYTASPSDDNIVKNGAGVYNGYKVDFQLVGYYPQFTAFINDLSLYPYFINLAKFEVVPYQYDKRILIAQVTIVFYSKKNS